MRRTLGAAYWIDRLRASTGDAIAAASALADEDPRATAIVVGARDLLASVDVFVEKIGARSVAICSNPTHTTACCLEKL